MCCISYQLKDLIHIPVTLCLRFQTEICNSATAESVQSSTLMSRLPKFTNKWSTRHTKNSPPDTKVTSKQVEMTSCQENRIVEETGLVAGSGDNAAGILGLREIIAEQEAKQTSGSAVQRSGGSKHPRYMLNIALVHAKHISVTF